MLKLPASALMAVSFAVLLSATSGCNDAFDASKYQTFSTDDADRVEQERRERSEQATAAAEAEAASPDQQSSPVVLAAAQTAARAARPEETAPANVDSPTENGERAQESTPPDGKSTTETGDVAAKSPAEAAAAKAARLVTGEPEVRTVKLLIPDRTFNVEGPDEALRVSYDDFDLLKVLNMEPVPPDAVEHFPSWLADLNGKQVRVRGFMYPTFQETDIPGFVLARDNQICCFGRNPKIYDLVEVTLKEGVTTDYIQGRPFDVVGTFHIAPEADDGELWQLYQIDDAVVIDH